MAMESKALLQFDALPMERKAALANKPILTAGEIALLCGVAPRSVSKWFDMGHFPGGYRLPNTNKNPKDENGQNGDRRVPREDVIAFARKHKILRVITLMCSKEIGPVVLVGLAPSQVRVAVEQVLATQREVVVSHTLVEATIAVAKSKFPPTLLVVHADNPASQIKLLSDYAGWRAKTECGTDCPVFVIYPDNYAVPDASLPETVYQKPESHLLSIFEKNSDQQNVGA